MENSIFISIPDRTCMMHLYIETLYSILSFSEISRKVTQPQSGRFTTKFQLKICFESNKMQQPTFNTTSAFCARLSEINFNCCDPASD